MIQWWFKDSIFNISPSETATITQQKTLETHPVLISSQFCLIITKLLISGGLQGNAYKEKTPQKSPGYVYLQER